MGCLYLWVVSQRVTGSSLTQWPKRPVPRSCFLVEIPWQINEQVPTKHIFTEDKFLGLRKELQAGNENLFNLGILQSCLKDSWQSSLMKVSDMNQIESQKSEEYMKEISMVKVIYYVYFNLSIFASRWKLWSGFNWMIIVNLFCKYIGG